MPDPGLISLTDSTCLVGHDGWGDGRLGDYHGSDVMLNDFGLIGEFGGFEEDADDRLARLHALGDEAADGPNLASSASFIYTFHGGRPTE